MNLTENSNKQYIRKAKTEDYSRIAEIYVYNNRLEYFPIFNNVKFSFGELQVLSYIDELKAKSDLSVRVYDDGVVKGFFIIEAEEITKIYVDSFFQHQGIGSELLKYAINNCNGKYLWVLLKNERAVRFYEHHGFRITEEKDTLYGPYGQKEILIKMMLKD